jgi:GntR family transcriptional regulator/MocR family aminotransferase
VWETLPAVVASPNRCATRVAAGAYLQPARLAVDFRPGVPDLSSFPRRDWLWALREAARDAPTDGFGYGDPRGSAALREVLAAYLRRVRGAVADPERMVICSGFAQGLNLVLRALGRHGVRRVAIEDPGDLDQRDIAARAALRTVLVQVDGAGVDARALAASDARAVVVTAAHQSPTGVVLAPQRRQALIAWAGERDATIIEDDYDAELRYDREPVGAVQGLAPDRVALLGTVSKSLAPALRLGWIVCPAGLAEAIAAEKDLDDRGSPTLDQLALASLIQSGRYDRHLRRMRASYARRREVLVESLARHAPQVDLHGLAAGFHAVAHLPESLSEPAVVSAARARSIGLYGMSRYRASGDTSPPRLVLGFGNLREGAIARGIATIGDLLHDKR